MPIRCRNCREPIVDDSKSCLNELGLFCSKKCYNEYREKHPIDYENQVGISSLF